MITLKTISRQNQFISVTVKLGIQMNAKIGGEIWQVHIPTKTLMVIGIDMYRGNIKNINFIDFKN